jgi:hypothetical protein
MSVNFSNKPTRLGLDYFQASLNEMGGISKLARFAVQIKPIGSNKIVNQPYYSKINQLLYACYAAEFPGRGFDLLSTRYYGPSQTFPINSKYGTAAFSFICRNNSMERQLFDDWQSVINPTSTFNFEYPGNYYSDINIFHYSEIGEPNRPQGSSELQLNYAWTLRKAWPSLVKPQPVTWMDTDFLFLEVEFTYRYWDYGDKASAAGEWYGDTNPPTPTPPNVEA